MLQNPAWICLITYYAHRGAMISSVLSISIMAVIVAASLLPMSFAQERSTVLYMDPLQSSTNAGDTIVFSGYLTTADGYAIQSATIHIKDDVSFGSDETLDTVVTDANGKFYGTWEAQTRGGGGAYDFYAVFEGSDRFDSARSPTYSVTVSGYAGGTQEQIASTFLTLESLPQRAYVGDAVTFSGVLETADGRVPPGAQIHIKDDIFGGSDDVLGTVVTGNSGDFLMTWTAQPRSGGGAYDFYAVFDGSGLFESSRSQTHSVNVIKHGGSISLDFIPSSASVGDRVDFSGTLKLDGASPEGAVVYIKDEDTGSRDELLATAYVDRNGRFSTYWFTHYTDLLSDTVDIFAVFEGNDDFERLTTCSYLCKDTHKLLVTGTFPSEPPTPPEPPTTPKPPNDRVAENSYMEMYYAMNLNSSPRVAIIPDPDSYDKVRGHIVPAREGILMWTYEMERRYGGNWDIDFMVIHPGTRFDGEPNVVINLVTPERDEKCERDYWGVAWVPPSTPVEPVQAHVCSIYQGHVRDNTDVAAAAAHEFIHGMGLGHAFNIDGDLMCSVEDGIPTCLFLVPRSKNPSVLNLDAVAEIYGTDGFKNPNNQFEYGYKFYAVERDSGSAEVGPVEGTGPEQTTRPSTYMLMAGGDEFAIPYSAGRNSIVAMAANLESMSLAIEADIASDGEIVIALPRHLIDAKNADGTDDTYIVLVNGEEAWVTETADSAARTLTIQVIAGDREIEIFGTQAIPEFGAPDIQNGPVGGTGPEQTTRPSTYMLMAGGDEFAIPYSAGSNSIVAMAANLESMSLAIEADITSDSEIVITLPRHLINPRNADGTDAAYIVLVNGEEVWVTETADSATRTLTIQVIAGDREIEIFGTQAIPEFGAPDIQNGPVGGTGPEQTARPSTYMLMAGGDEFAIPYSAGSNSIVAMAVNLESMSLAIEVDIASDGKIVIALPRHLIDAKNADGTDDTYIVLVDGEDAWVTETADSAARTLTIPVSAGAQAIEIFGTFIVPEFGTIAILILAAAVVSMIVVSGRTRLSVMPKH